MGPPRARLMGAARPVRSKLAPYSPDLSCITFVHPGPESFRTVRVRLVPYRARIGCRTPTEACGPHPALDLYYIP